MYHYILIDRERHPDLAVRYSTKEEAERALTDSLYIDGVCQEDCLDAYTSDTVSDGRAVVIPPDETPGGDGPLWVMDDATPAR